MQGGVWPPWRRRAALAKYLAWLTILLVVISACVAPRTPEPPLSPRQIRLEGAIGEEGVDSREIFLLWEDLAGAGVEFQLPLVRPVTHVLFRVPQAADFWVQCRQLNGDLELSLGYINDEQEKDHKIRPHFWRTANRAELLIDATWKESVYYALDAKAEVPPEMPWVLFIRVYGRR